MEQKKKVLCECTPLKDLRASAGAAAELSVVICRSEFSTEQFTRRVLLPSKVAASAPLFVCHLSEDLPASVLEMGLQRLNLMSHGEFQDLPEWLKELTGLQQLKLWQYNSLKKLPLWTGEMHGLQRLDLSGCRSLAELPASMGGMTGLQHLNLSGCVSLAELPASMGGMTGLQHLNLSHCVSLAELPGWMGGMTGLQHLDLPWCESLAELPGWMGGMTGLRHLDLSCCKSLAELPGWMGGMTGLWHLDLSRCESLAELPGWMGGMTGLQLLDLSGCRSLHTPPEDVQVQGTAAVLQYLSDLSKGSASQYLIKLVLVGDQCAGKSSLIDSFRMDAPRPRAASDRTVGIDICRWRPDARSKVIAQVFDAAGHKVYHASHRIFMSRDALYLMVVRCDKGLDYCLTSLCKWMDLVQTAAPGCVMAVVVTHTDQFSGDVAEFLDTLFRNAQVAYQTVLSQLDEQIHHLEDKVGRLLENESMDSDAWVDLRSQRNAMLSELDGGLVTSLPIENESVDSDEGSGMVTIKDKVDDKKSAPWTPAGISMQKRLAQCHAEMCKLESRVLAESDGSTRGGMRARVAQLRHERCNRLRVIFCGGVSNTSGEGHSEQRRALQRILGSRELFGHLGMKVPLNYLLLERCMRLGDTLAVEAASQQEVDQEDEFGTRVWTDGTGEKLAGWEMAVVSHCQQKARECGEGLSALKALCSRPVVKLAKLTEVAATCGINGHELMSAIRFLHASGSLLYFGKPRRQVDGGEGQGGGKLSGTEGERALEESVFTQPAWIIDAVKCFVHEPKLEDVNEAFRRGLQRVEQQHAPDLKRYHASGRLTLTLLRRLWTNLGTTPDFCLHESVLLPLLCSLQLMFPLDVYAGGAGRGSAVPTYVVPAMFPANNLPAKLVEPSVWAPAEAEGAEGFMRREYKGVGYVPHGFLSELQVAWSSGQGAAKHYARQEDALASSLGSHLIAAYDGVEEQVVVSLWQELGTSEGGSVAKSRLCVCAWSRVRERAAGTPEWRLFQRVTECIEHKGAETHCALLLTDPVVPVMAGSDVCHWVPLSDCVEALSSGEHQVYYEEDGEDGSFRSAPLHLLIPLRPPAPKRAREEQEAEARKRSKGVDGEGRVEAKGGGEQMEVDSIAGARQAGRVESGERPRILAFFAQTHEGSLNTRGESQNLTKSMLYPHYFEFDPHARPLFPDFQVALMCCASKNTRIVHLAGHIDQEGFHFAKEERGSATEPIKPEVVTDLLVQASASHRGTVECAVLNACSTEDMGRRLRAEGVKHVVCWRGEVYDEAAMEFSKMFYQSLQFSAGAGCTSIPPGAYKAAFKQGCAALRVWKKTPGPSRGKTGVEHVPLVTGLEVKARVVLLLSEDGDEVLHCADQAGGEGGDAA